MDNNFYIWVKYIKMDIFWIYKPKILIDSKHFDTTVPKKDLDKFYADIQLQNCSGILCNAFGGIANRKDFSIDFVDNNILVFIHNHKLLENELNETLNEKIWEYIAVDTSPISVNA